MQTDTYINCLKTLSKQNVVYLNPLGKGNYNVLAGFNELTHKKFYHIRSLFKKMSTYNQSAKFKPKPISSSPHNIYQELSLNNENYLLRVVDENELRLDLFIKELAP